MKLKQAVLALMVVALTGCANMQATGDWKAGLANAAQDKSKPKDFLSALEAGEVRRISGNYDGATDAWLFADVYVRGWEDKAKSAPEALLEGAGSFLINDKVRTYDGKDYERVALASRLAMNYLSKNDWDKARTEVTKLHERESIIADFRDAQYEKVRKDSKSENVKTDMTVLNGYPVNTLDAAEVTSLRNSYQSAIGHYLAGFVYEQSGDTSLAAAGYRQAIELRPDSQSLRAALKGLDQRIHRTDPKNTDTLIIVESGEISPIKSMTIALPVYSSDGYIAVPMSFPVITPLANNGLPANVLIDGKPAQIDGVTNYDAMARRALKDEMPGIILRSTIRAIAKGTAIKQAQKQGNALASLFVNIVAIASEVADDRMWRALPANVGISRQKLAIGSHTLSINGENFPFNVSGRYAVVTLRSFQGRTYANVPTNLTDVAPTALASTEPAPDVTPVPTKPKTKTKTKSKKVEAQ